MFWTKWKDLHLVNASRKFGAERSDLNLLLTFIIEQIQQQRSKG